MLHVCLYLPQVTDCSDLDAADVLSNSSDPYCKVHTPHQSATRTIPQMAAI